MFELPPPRNWRLSPDENAPQLPGFCCLWIHQMCQGRSTTPWSLGMGDLQPLMTGILIMGIFSPLLLGWWVYPLLYGNNWNLDPALAQMSFFFFGFRTPVENPTWLNEVSWTKDTNEAENCESSVFFGGGGRIGEITYTSHFQDSRTRKHWYAVLIQVIQSDLLIPWSLTSRSDALGPEARSDILETPSVFFPLKKKTQQFNVQNPGNSLWPFWDG